MICIHFGCGRLCFKEGRMRFIEVPIYMPLLISEDSVLFHQHISHFSIETLQALLRQIILSLKNMMRPAFFT